MVFVCESPGRQFASHNEAAPSRCWARTGQDQRFREAREKYAYADCYITNTVKCGVRKGGRHTPAEVALCLRFLARELDLLKPLIAVGVGGNAYRTLRRDVRPRLKSPPVLFEITHYSARGDIWPRWESEFDELKHLLKCLKRRS